MKHTNTRAHEHTNTRSHETGFLFDLFAKGSQMVLWFLTDAGRAVRLVDDFAPEVFLSGAPRALSACLRDVERAGDGEAVGWTERRDIWTGEPRRVFAVRVNRIQTWRRSLQRLARRHPLVSWSNADLLPEQLYAYERDIFPLARCTFRGRGGRLVSLKIEDDRWTPQYAPPPFRVAELHGEGRLFGCDPHLDSLTLTHGGQSTTWDEPAGMLEGFQSALDRLDPDVILTDGGDSFLLPLLLTVAQRADFTLRLDREPPPSAREVQTEGRSFFSYGRVLYHAPDYPLFGRWHMDRRNSFMVGEMGLDGLIEVSRLSRLPPQRIGRRSIGTGISSVQLDMAHREGFLIPWKKTHPEAWKTARQLMFTDRGGLVYAPDTGFHERVVELDFVSMYPAIMSRFNVSPETVNCACCANARVPEIGYTTCERRRGLVSRALEPIIAKRVALKRLRAAAAEAGDEASRRRFDDRQAALKWMLVCCFGYLGYRNARFGRIEAHEAVSAYSRELIVAAKEVCEARGWRLLHANVDSVWIVKPGFARGEIAPLCEAIDAATGLTIALEGIYRWIAFLPSRQYPDRPVPTRFFGAFEDGSLKCRGIEARRDDLPLFVREVQVRLLNRLAAAPDGAAYRAMAPALLAEIEEEEARLRRHEVPLEDLVIRQSLSKNPEEYRGRGMQAAAARQSVRAGLRLHAGQALRYVIVDRAAPEPEERVRLAPLIDADTACDPDAYIRLLRRAANTLLWPMDIVLDEDVRPPRRRRERRGSGQLDLLG